MDVGDGFPESRDSKGAAGLTNPRERGQAGRLELGDGDRVHGIHLDIVI